MLSNLTVAREHETTAQTAEFESLVANQRSISVLVFQNGKPINLTEKSKKKTDVKLTALHQAKSLVNFP